VLSALTGILDRDVVIPLCFLGCVRINENALITSSSIIAANSNSAILVAEDAIVCKIV
jgi:hypothetical protein